MTRALAIIAFAFALGAFASPALAQHTLPGGYGCTVDICSILRAKYAME